jgi:hypothetical protein
MTAATVGTTTVLCDVSLLAGLYGQVELTPVTQQFCRSKELKLSQIILSLDASVFRDSMEKRERFSSPVLGKANEVPLAQS